MARWEPNTYATIFSSEFLFKRFTEAHSFSKVAQLLKRRTASQRSHSFSKDAQFFKGHTDFQDREASQEVHSLVKICLFNIQQAFEGTFLICWTLK